MQVGGAVLIDSPNQYGSVQHLDPYRYRKVIYGYRVGYIDWSSKDLDAIETELTLIYQRMGLVKYPVPIGGEVRSVS